MYTPEPFRESDVGVMLDFIDARPLGTLITVNHDTSLHTDASTAGVLATHLPFLLDRTRGEIGVLQGHVARANPHGAATATEALVIFTGPDAYVTPSWYASTREHGRVVPTWNYIAVHATGRFRLIEDPDFLRQHVTALTARHESVRERPWSVSDAPPEHINKLLREIIGLEIEITRLEGKWKMSQNRSASDITGVVAGLGASESPSDQEVSRIVEARRPRRK